MFWLNEKPGFIKLARIGKIVAFWPVFLSFVDKTLSFAVAFLLFVKFIVEWCLVALFSKNLDFARSARFTPQLSTYGN